jgi:hypothetical protein
VRNLLKILIIGLLLVLMVAVGAEVVAWKKTSLPMAAQSPIPVLVRKANPATAHPKTVRIISSATRGTSRPAKHAAREAGNQSVTR